MLENPIVERVDMDKENWKTILLGYKVSEKHIKHPDFFKTHNIHKSLVKKFCTWFKADSGYKLEENGNNPKKLFIELK